MTADQVLAALAGANLAAAAAIVLVLALRRPARKMLGPQVAYGLWLVVPAAAVASLAPARVIVVEASPSAATDGVAAITGWVLAATPSSAGPGFDPVAILVGLWLAGAAASCAVALLRSRRVARDPSLGPALLGVFRPRLILPPDFEVRFDAHERRLVLAHEAVHAAARHPLINGLIEAGRCLCWFNPLVHVAAFYARVDQELACDAAVLARHPDQRRAYAETLLKTQLAPAFLPLGCQWPGRSKPLLAERIEMLALPSSGRRRRFAGGAAVALIAAGSGYAVWAAQPPRVVEAPPPAPAAAAASAAAEATADPPQAVEAGPLPDRVTLTNAGGVLSKPAAPRNVEEAIKAGNALAVRELGGSPADVISALQSELAMRDASNPERMAERMAMLNQFIDTSRGASVGYVPFTGPEMRTLDGRNVGGAHWGLERRTADGMVQNIMLMRDGNLFIGAPHPPDPPAIP